MSLKKNPRVDLKIKYKRFFETGLIISLLFVIAAFKYFPELQSKGEIVKASQELITVEDVEQTKQDMQQPTPVKPLLPIEAPSDQILEDIEIEENILDVNEVINSLPPKIIDDSKDVEEVPDIYFFAVEEYPEPIGGIAGIMSRIVYPDFARRAGVQGKVTVLAYVNESGDVMKVELIKGIGAGCDEAALDAVKLTKFKPGKQRGKAVKVKIGVPIVFKLSQ